MNPRLPAIIVLLLSCAFAGCAETIDATKLGVPATLATAAGAPAEGSHFVVSQRAVYGLWGIATLKLPSLRKALAAQLAGSSSVVGLKIKIRSRWSDVLVTALTLGLIVPRSVTFEGAVAK